MPNTSIQSSGARNDPELVKKYLERVLATSSFVIAEDPATPNHELRKRVADKIISNRGQQQTYSNLFMDRSLSSLTLTHPRFNVASIANSTPVQVTVTSHGYNNGDIVLLTGISEPSELNNGRYAVANKTTDTIDLHDLSDKPVDGRGFAQPYDSGGYVYKDIPTDTEVNATISALFGDVDFLIDFIDIF